MLTLSSQPLRTGCHKWHQACELDMQYSEETAPDIMLETYLDAKHCHYCPEDLGSVFNLCPASRTSGCR